MQVSKIRIKNIKTFDDITLDLNKFNVLIGACASGKTNFVQVFELLNDISQDFHKAIRKHGGAYIKNFNLLENNLESCLEVILNNSKRSIKLNGNSLGLKEDIILDFYQVKYEICFNFNKTNCEVVNEIVELDCDIKTKNEVDSNNKIIIENNKGNIKAKFLNNVDFLDIAQIIPNTLIDIVSENFKKDNTPIINSALATIPIEWADSLKNIYSYNFDPKFLKSIDFNNNDDDTLSKFGGNLPSVLKKILNNEEMKKEFLIYYTTIQPYVKDIIIEKILDEEHIFMIIEKYNDVKIPAPFISDGTSTIMAILIALYFQEGEVVLIEEPERHIHPSLITELMLLMESVEDKQVIITTHSPEILKYAELENINFISRDENGFSNIQKVIDDEVAKPFIDELGIDSAFVNNILGLK